MSLIVPAMRELNSSTIQPLPRRHTLNIKSSIANTSYIVLSFLYKNNYIVYRNQIVLFRRESRKMCVDLDI